MDEDIDKRCDIRWEEGEAIADLQERVMAARKNGKQVRIFAEKRQMLEYLKYSREVLARTLDVDISKTSMQSETTILRFFWGASSIWRDEA